MQLIRSRWPVRIVVLILCSPVFLLLAIFAYRILFDCHQFFIPTADGSTNILEVWPTSKCGSQFPVEKVQSAALLREFPREWGVSTLMVRNTHLYVGFAVRGVDIDHGKSIFVQTHEEAKQLVESGEASKQVRSQGGVFRMNVADEQWEDVSHGLKFAIVRHHEAVQGVTIRDGYLVSPELVDVNSLFAADTALYAGTHYGAYVADHDVQWRRLDVGEALNDAVITDVRLLHDDVLINGTLGVSGTPITPYVQVGGLHPGQDIYRIVQSESGLFASIVEGDSIGNAIYVLRDSASDASKSAHQIWMKLSVTFSTPIMSMAADDSFLYVLTRGDGLVRIDLHSGDYHSESFSVPDSLFFHQLVVVHGKVFAASSDCVYAFDLMKKQWSQLRDCLRCKRGAFSAMTADDAHIYLGSSRI